MRPSFIISSVTLLATVAFSGACSSSSSSEPNDGGLAPAADGGAEASACADGIGTLNVRVSGVPAGSFPRITVTGSTGAREMPGGELELTAGDYTLSPAPVAVPDPLVRTLLYPSPASATVKVCGGFTTNSDVGYAALGSSNKLWVGNANGAAPILGFAPSALGATSTQPATVVARTKGAGGIAFDRDGNLWVLGGTTVDPTLLRYPASTLGASGTPTADRKIDIKSTGCSPLAHSLAFDGSGNLWVSLQCASSIARLTPTDLATDGEKVPGVVISGLTSPRGIAFDSNGNLWVADVAVIRAYAAARLAASNADPATAVLTVMEGQPATAMDTDDLAFDANGDLWAVGDTQTNVRRIAKADLITPGVRNVTPAVAISVGVGALPQGIAFDEGGGLWIATSSKKFARLGPTQLTTSSTYAAPTIPERVITSDDVGSAGSIALFPAPRDLPIYSRAP
jgi:streptogramin lyase